MGPQCPAGNVTVVVSTIYVQSVRYSALEALCYLDTVECCSPDTPPAIPHRRWGWSSLLSSSSCVSEFGSLWSTAGNSWTMFPRIPIGHLVAGMKFGHLSSLSLQPKLATNIKHILFSILESKQGKQITLKKYTSRSQHLPQSAERVRNFLWIQIGDTLLYGFIAKLSSQPVMKQQLARYNAGTKWARFPCTLTHTYSWYTHNCKLFTYESEALPEAFKWGHQKHFIKIFFSEDDNLRAVTQAAKNNDISHFLSFTYFGVNTQRVIQSRFYEGEEKKNKSLDDSEGWRKRTSASPQQFNDV